MAQTGVPKILHSLYGNKFGINKDGYECSQQQSIVTESTAVALSYSGISALSSATGTYSLPPPPIGCVGMRKLIYTTSTSTLVRTITLSAGNFQSTAGTSFITYTLASGGQYLNLLGISTAAYFVLGTNSSAAPTT